MSFWVEATDSEAAQMISKGLVEVGKGNIPPSLQAYTRSEKDIEINKQYWKIKTIRMRTRTFDVERWFLDNYPEKKRYTTEELFGSF